MLVRRLLSHGPDVTLSRSYPRAMILNRIRAAADAPLDTVAAKPPATRRQSKCRQRRTDGRVDGKRRLHPPQPGMQPPSLEATQAV